MNVKWIKIAVDIFDNRKIKQIEIMPEGDTLVVIWFKLLCLAGNINDGGLIYLTKEIAYTEEMLAAQFNKPLTTIRLALNVFEKFGMIEIVNDIICLSNWEKYQNLDKLAEIREQNRARQKRYYDRQKEKMLASSNANLTLGVTLPNGTDIDIDKDIDKEKDISNDISKKKNPKHKYGQYDNVLLTDEEMEKLHNEFPFDWQERIERLSEYVASTGKSYKNHLATIRSWAKKETKVSYPKAKGNIQDLNDVAIEVEAILEREGW